MLFLGSPTTDIKIHTMDIVLSVPLHQVQGKGVHSGNLFPGILSGARGAPNLENLPVGQECNILKTVQMENYMTDGHHSSQSFFTRLPTKIGVVYKSEMAELVQAESLKFDFCR